MSKVPTTTMSEAIFRGSPEMYHDHKMVQHRAKPTATLERAAGYITKRERDVGPALGDALAIIWKAHSDIRREQRQSAKEVSNGEKVLQGDRVDDRRGSRPGRGHSRSDRGRDASHARTGRRGAAAR